jgi:serine/threonine protein kinase
MEYCDAGSALDILVQLKKPFTEEQISACLYQSVLGLAHLHSMSPKVINYFIKYKHNIYTLDYS